VKRPNSAVAKMTGFGKAPHLQKIATDIARVLKTEFT
jgi:hypothetical protein